jgi:hypothetical protein
METQVTYKLWNYEFSHYVPVTPDGGGKIQWHKISDYREIYLPLDVEDPVRFLQQSGERNESDLLEYAYFSTPD